MKIKTVFVSTFALTVALGISAISLCEKEAFKSEAIPSTQNIDLNKSTDAEIKNYYSDLNSTSYNGESLLGALQPILAENYVGFDYDDDIKYIYKITDRNWEASPASEISGYDASTNTIPQYKQSNDSDPYIWHLYVDHDYQKTNPIHFQGATRVSFDKEHVWPQSHGFPGPDPNAGTDLHHLIAADHYVNSTLHNNYSYGNVDTSKSYAKGDTTQTANNLRGTALNLHPTLDEETTVIEPQDSDKGDIARALLYMVARYNNIVSGNTPSIEEPNLRLVNYVIKNGVSCSSTNPVANYGILTDILKWHHDDPVDDYEIYRNDLIDKNYQHNRNPFIDYPDWVDMIWNADGTYYNGSVVADPINNSIHVAKGIEEGKYTKIEVTTNPDRILYGKGETLDTTGIVITGTKKDSTTETITTGLTYSETSLSTLGKHTITVTHTETNLKTSFDVQVCDIVYQASSKTTLEPLKGIYPTGASGSYTQTYSVFRQATSGNSMTYQISGLTGYKVTDMSLVMHSNASKGAGSFAATIGDSTIASLPNTSFNAWYDSSEFTSQYKVVNVSLTDTAKVIQTAENLNVNVTASENSLYLYSVGINIKKDGSLDDETYEKPVYELVTDASTLQAGDHILFESEYTSSGTEKHYVVNKLNEASNYTYIKSTEVTPVNNLIQSDSLYDITLGGSSGAWALSTYDGLLGVPDTTKTPLSYNAVSNNTFKISISDGTATVQLSSDTGNRAIRYNASSGTYRFGYYLASSTNKNISIYKRTTAYNDYDFAYDFLRTQKCDGVTAPSTYSWSVLKDKYNTLSAATKLKYKNGEPDTYLTFDITATHLNKEMIAACLHRYELIIAKYDYENFIDRTVANSQRFIKTDNQESLFAVFASVLALSLVSGFIVIIKKKKSRTR